MRKILAAGIAAGLLLSIAPAATAHPFFHHRGGCVLAVANDEVPSQPLGGPTDWNGVAAIAVVATRADGITPALTAPIVGRCDLYINNLFKGTLVTAPPGIGATAGATLTSFTANPGDSVSICAVVQVSGEPHTRCDPVSTTQVAPQEVVDFTAAVKFTLDPLLCPLFAPFAPGIPPFVTVDPATGDVAVLGELIWDCAPYGLHNPPRPITPLTTRAMVLIQV